MYRSTHCLSLLFLISSAATAQTAADVDRLFVSDDVLEVRIAAPFAQIMRERPEDEDVAGLLRYTDTDGRVVELDIGIRTRGKFRRRKSVCAFAPLRLNVTKSQAVGTAFDNQDKLKLVTHCRDNSARYEQAVLTEYLAYRILNLLTDVSHRVRLVHVTYAYTDSSLETVRYGFLIEHEDRLAKRIGEPVVASGNVKISALRPDYLNLVSVFQYLIGNTDFSPIVGPSGEACCHNFTLFGTEGEPYYSVPYDFDQSGIVNAPHGEPNPRFKLRSVRQRLYRGRCVNNALLEATLARFREQRGSLEALIDTQAGLSKKTRSATRTYLRSFYKTIDNPKQLDRRIVRKCI